MAHVQSLFEFFLGTAKTIKQPVDFHLKSSNFVFYLKKTIYIKNEQLIRNPSNTRIRIKLYPYLLKSRLASTIFPHAIQVKRESRVK